MDAGKPIPDTALWIPASLRRGDNRRSMSGNAARQFHDHVAGGRVRPLSVGCGDTWAWPSRAAQVSGWRGNSVVWTKRSDLCTAVRGSALRRPHARRLDPAVALSFPGRSSKGRRRRFPHRYPPRLSFTWDRPVGDAATPCPSFASVHVRWCRWCGDPKGVDRHDCRDDYCQDLRFRLWGRGGDRVAAGNRRRPWPVPVGRVRCRRCGKR
jgi:hypothetical protein